MFVVHPPGPFVTCAHAAQLDGDVVEMLRSAAARISPSILRVASCRPKLPSRGHWKVPRKFGP